MGTNMDTRQKVCGVVEGFYGRPWTFTQRKQLFDRMKGLRMNTYLYAPKDDVKHRQMWRELYSMDECYQLQLLIDSSIENNVMFVYAISPGLDITFSNDNDIQCIKNKMKQVMHLGCNAFAILFDDIDPNLNAVDRQKYQSLAMAQVTLTNELYSHLNKPRFFLFCPTEYCATRAVPSVLNSEYLNTVGEKLEPNIDVMWTGPKVISKSISVDSIEELAEVLRRYPVIWDNLHANDYDQKRLFLGPYCGRNAGLLTRLRGVLTNPNCEFEANFIPVHTLALWFQLSDDGGENAIYEPQHCLEEALRCWMLHLYKNILEPRTDPSVEPAPTKSVAKAMLATAAGSLPPSTASMAVVASQLLSHEVCTAAVVAAIGMQDDSQPQEQHQQQQQQLEDMVAGGASPMVGEVAAAATAAAAADVVGETAVAPNCEVEDSTQTLAALESALVVGDEQQKDAATAALAVASVVQHAAQQEAMEICEAEYIQEVLQQEMLHSLKEKKDDPNDCSLMRKTLFDPNGKDHQCQSDEASMMQVDEVFCESMDVPPNDNETGSQAEGCPADETSLTLADLRLLVDLYYLPYEHGGRAVKMLELVHWLRSHAHLVDRNDNQFDTENAEIVDGDVKTAPKLMDRLNGSIEQSTHWRSKAADFHREVDQIRLLVNRFCAIPNRAVLSDFYSYLQDVRHVLESLDSYIRWMESAKVSYKNVCALRRLLSWCTPGYKEMFTGDDYESWMFRGGVIAEFQRMFPIDNAYDMFPIRASFILYPTDFTVNGLLLSEYASGAPSSNYPCSVGPVCLLAPSVPGPATTRLGPRGPAAAYNVRPFRPLDPIDRDRLYSLCFSLVDSRSPLLACLFPSNHGTDSDTLCQLISTLPGDRYIGAYLDFCPELCLVLENEESVALGYALGCLDLAGFERYRREQYLPAMQLKYAGLGGALAASSSSDLGSDDDLRSRIGAVQSMLNFFLESPPLTSWLPSSLETAVFVQFDIKEYCKPYDLDTIDSLARKLLICLVSAFKTLSAEANDVNYSASLLNNPTTIQTTPSIAIVTQATLITTNSVPFVSLGPVVQVAGAKDRAPLVSLTMYAEVDSINRTQKDMYKRYGFTDLDIPSSGNELLATSCLSRLI